MAAVSVEATELFVGSVDAPLQVVRVSFTGAGSARVHVEGAGVSTPAPVELVVQGEVGVEVGVDTRGAAPGTTLPARAVVASGTDRFELDFDLLVAEPGWTMHMVSHFHYDPVWWNTQAAYTVAWDELDFPGSHRGARQLAGFDLVRAHLDLALAEPAYCFVLAEVDYLKPYWDTYPADRAVLRRLMAAGPRRGHGRHVQRAQHEPDRPRDDHPQLRARHGFPARRPRRRPGHRLAARRVRPRPRVPRHAPPTPA